MLQHCAQAGSNGRSSAHARCAEGHSRGRNCVACFLRFSLSRNSLRRESLMSAVSYLAAGNKTRDRWGAAPSWMDHANVRVNQFLAAMLLLLFSPLMLVVALLIWRRDGAPILFAHYRVGLHGRLFRCFKFRTMLRDAEQRLSDLLASNPQAREEWGREQKLANDPRITPVGHFLRRTSLDELPQLFNVLRGEMSLVGPRPITVGELTRYG